MELVNLALDALRRRIRLFLIFSLIFFVGGFAGIYVKRASYESTAKMLVNLEGLGVSLSQADIPLTGPQVQAVEAITSQVELLTSKRLVEEMVDRLGIETFRSPPPGNPYVRFVVDTVAAISSTVSGALQRIGLVETIGERDAIIEALQSSLRVYPVRQSQIIVVSLRWRNPSVPPLALQTLLDLFLAKTEAIDTKQSEFGIFTEQVTMAAAALSTAEAELREFQKHNDVADLSREKQMLIDRIDRLTAMGVASLGGSGHSAPDNTAGVSVDGTNPDLGGVVDQLAELHSRLNALRVDRARAATTYTARHRTVRELDNQIAATEATLQGENARLRNMVVAARERLHALQEAEQNFNRISRNIEIASQAYQTYRKVAADRAVMLAHDTKVHIQIIDPPDSPLRAVGPSRLIWAIVALVLSLVAAALTVLVAEAFSRRDRTASVLAAA